MQIELREQLSESCHPYEDLNQCFKLFLSIVREKILKSIYC